MPIKIFSPPPSQTNLLSSNAKEKINEYWQRWVDELHYRLSNRSFQTITSAQAVNVNARYVALDTTNGAFAITLAAPDYPTQPLMIEMTVKGGANNVTMALTNCENGTASTTCTWNSVGDTLILQSRSNKWIIQTQDGVALT